MDWIRTGYETTMELWGPDRPPVPVRWFRAAPDAKVFDGVSIWRSVDWLCDKGDNGPFPPLGKREKYDKGKDVVGYKGTKHVGPARLFATTAKWGKEVPYCTDDEGAVPECRRNPKAPTVIKCCCDVPLQEQYQGLIHDELMNPIYAFPWLYDHDLGMYVGSVPPEYVGAEPGDVCFIRHFCHESCEHWMFQTVVNGVVEIEESCAGPAPIVDGFANCDPFFASSPIGLTTYTWTANLAGEVEDPDDPLPGEDCETCEGWTPATWFFLAEGFDGTAAAANGEWVLQQLDGFPCQWQHTRDGIRVLLQKLPGGGASLNIYDDAAFLILATYTIESLPDCCVDAPFGLVFTTEGFFGPSILALIPDCSGGSDQDACQSDWPDDIFLEIENVTGCDALVETYHLTKGGEGSDTFWGGYFPEAAGEHTELYIQITCMPPYGTFLVIICNYAVEGEEGEWGTVSWNWKLPHTSLPQSLENGKKTIGGTHLCCTGDIRVTLFEEE